jgi:hypothetical protein
MKSDVPPDEAGSISIEKSRLNSMAVGRGEGLSSADVN